MKKILYCAAHGGFAGEPVPLGGGAAIFEKLCSAWRGAGAPEVEAITPAILPRPPRAREVVGYSARQYARFCAGFSEAATRRILDHPPDSCAVLVNDISEGPDFRLLARRGYRMACIYHVDVVAYCAAMYLGGWILPEQLTRWHRTLRQSPASRLLPAIAGLVFEKQLATIECCERILVPSTAMREGIRRCYPEMPWDRVAVVPWGSEEPPPLAEDEISAEAARMRREFSIEDGEPVLLMLSRISPEKGHDVLIKAMGLLNRPMPLVICGEAAFMHGAAFEKKIRSLASRTRRARVHFAGYAAGARKQAAFRIASLYVFPSRHESYGLTLLEAMRAGLPAIALDHSGAKDLLDETRGAVVASAPAATLPSRLAGTITRLLADPARLLAMGRNARAFAESAPFDQTARTVAALTLGMPLPSNHVQNSKHG